VTESTREGDSASGRVVTSHDVAAAAGVAQSTVSRAFRGDPKITPATRQRVVDAAAALGYVPSHLGRALSSRRTHTVGLVTVDIGNSFYTQLLDEVIAEFSLRGYRVLLFMEPISGPADVARYSMLLDGSLEGVLFTNAMTTSKAPQHLSRRGLPVVLAVRSVDGSGLDTVVSDNLMGGQEAGRHIGELGHRRAAMILGPSETSTSRDRDAGVTKALAEFGVTVPNDLRMWGTYSHEHGYARAMDVLTSPDRPTALICANDVIGLGAYEAAIRLNLRIPQDISIIGFDDISMAGWASFQLTTVRQRTADIGRLAARRLVERMEDPNNLPARTDVFPMNLVQRRTTGPPAG
jgi:LacI family transcriptional regulator